MAVCNHFMQGRCRYGADCRYEHPGQETQYNRQPNRGYQPPNRGHPSQNRFAPLTQPANSGFNGGNVPRGPAAGRNFSGAGPSGRGQLDIDVETIQRDLTLEKPEWPFSAYAPIREVPRQLLGGQLEQSAEELRAQFYLHGQSRAVEIGRTLEHELNAQSSRILNNLRGAIQYIADGQNEHPNRFEICENQTLPETQRGLFAIGRQQIPAANAFGQISAATGSQRTAFGQPSAFGSQSAQGASTFGQPSGLGGQQRTTFGQASQLSSQTSQTAGTFGQQRATFGQPSAFGSQAPQNSSAFGQPSFPSANNGATQASHGSSAFGQPSFPNATPAATFGQPSGVGANDPSAFGQPSPMSATPFTQPSQTAAQRPSPFTQQSNPASGSSPFAQLNGNANNTANTSPFARQPSQQPQTNSNPFGQQQSNAFTQPPQSQQTMQPLPANSDVQPPMEAYRGEEKTYEEAYRYLKEKGQFLGGLMPEVAPQREWIT